MSPERGRGGRSGPLDRFNSANRLFSRGSSMETQDRPEYDLILSKPKIVSPCCGARPKNYPEDGRSMLDAPITIHFKKALCDGCTFRMELKPTISVPPEISQTPPNENLITKALTAIKREKVTHFVVRRGHRSLDVYDVHDTLTPQGRCFLPHPGEVRYVTGNAVLVPLNHRCDVYLWALHKKKK